MHYLLPLCFVLLLAGCNAPREQKSSASDLPNGSTAASTAEKALPAQSEATSVSPQLVRQTETSPAVLYQKCAACHGSHAEKSALNQSAIIGEWDAKRLVSSIVGYQDGTYGGAMKTLMQNQVKDLSRAQIEALAEYIANLYVRTH